MYQYSLAWFVALFVRCIEEAPKAADVGERGNNLNTHFTYALWVGQQWMVNAVEAVHYTHLPVEALVAG
jgi:hypothetical protein